MNQPAQPQQQVALQIDKMIESPHVWGDSDFSETEDVDIDETKIFWMGTNANLADTPQEQLENKLAIQEQIKKGILDEFGLPTGFSYDELGIPPEKQAEIKAAKEARAKQLAAARQPQQSLSQFQNRPQTNVQPPAPKKIYQNKYERKIDREKMREEQKRQEKLARANKIINQHQAIKPQGK